MTRDNWKSLAVYRSLLPKEVSKSFKKFAHYIADKLLVDNFKLEETNTVKKFCRFHAHVEQAIYIETLRSKTDFIIKIAIKPLFSDPEMPLPFFDKYQSFEKIVFQHEELLKHYHMTYGENNPGILPADHLIYDSSFRVRNFDLFNKYHNKFLNRELEIYERLKEDEKIRLEISGRIAQLNSLKEIILNDELYSREIKIQDENSKKYAETFSVK